MCKFRLLERMLKKVKHGKEEQCVKYLKGTYVRNLDRSHMEEGASR